MLDREWAEFVVFACLMLQHWIHWLKVALAGELDEIPESVGGAGDLHARMRASLRTWMRALRVGF